MHYTFSCPSENEKITLETHLLELGFTNLYTIEDGKSFLLGGFHDEKFDQLPFLASMEETPDIDWQMEWATHCPYFQEDRAVIPLSHGLSIDMVPGPGFGDLSHPTTRLMLDALTLIPKDSVVIDLGSGSGILSLAAKKLGALKVIGLEIDLAAIEHARLNATLNELDQIDFTDRLLLSNIPKDAIFLMNMTLIDQENLFQAYPSLPSHGSLWLISGVLEKQEHLLRKKFPKVKKLSNLQDWGLFQG